MRAARVAFVTSDAPRVSEEDVDRPLHERAFAERGLALEHCVWHDPNLDWSAYDLVVLRSPWDYSERLPEFLGWLERVEKLETLHNPAALVRWNLDKRYLGELAEHGVPVIATRYADSEDEVVRALAERGREEVVIKPVVSAGSRNTGRFRADDPRALGLARHILGERIAVMVQPFAAAVADEGELGLVLFDGELSHCFRKGPLLALGGGLLGGAYRESISAVAPTVEQRRVALTARDAVERICRARRLAREPLLYARFDLIRLDDGRIALLEAELFEPSFFLGADEAAAARFARVVERRVAQRAVLAAPARRT